MRGLFLVCLTLSACSATQLQTGLTAASQAIADGQLVCQVGPSFLALVDPSGAAVLAKGNSAAYVQQACALVHGAAVALPPLTAAVTAVVVPPAAPAA